MNREEEFEKVKQLIKENYDDAHCGLFDTRNIAGDYMTNIFDGKYFTLDICYNYSYFEVFGTTSEEYAILITFYNKLEKETNKMKNKKIMKSWRTIYAILKETGYVELYQDEITTIVNFIKNNL